MNIILKAALAGMGGAIVGAVALTVLAIAFIASIPGLRNDGQSGMVVFLTVPVGGVIGLISGLVWALVFGPA